MIFPTPCNKLMASRQSCHSYQSRGIEYPSLSPGGTTCHCIPREKGRGYNGTQGTEPKEVIFDFLSHEQPWAKEREGWKGIGLLLGTPKIICQAKSRLWQKEYFRYSSMFLDFGFDWYFLCLVSSNFRTIKKYAAHLNWFNEKKCSSLPFFYFFLSMDQ